MSVAVAKKQMFLFECLKFRVFILLLKIFRAKYGGVYHTCDCLMNLRVEDNLKSKLYEKKSSIGIY